MIAVPAPARAARALPATGTRVLILRDTSPLRVLPLAAEWPRVIRCDGSGCARRLNSESLVWLIGDRRLCGRCARAAA